MDYIIAAVTHTLGDQSINQSLCILIIHLKFIKILSTVLVCTHIIIMNTVTMHMYNIYKINVTYTKHKTKWS